MLAENKRSGKIVEFTLDQWENFKKTDHARYWTVIDAGIMPKEKIEPRQFGEPTTLTIEYHLNYREKLDEAGIKYDKRIKSEARLKEIYELNIPVVTTIPDKKVKT